MAHFKEYTDVDFYSDVEDLQVLYRGRDFKKPSGVFQMGIGVLADPFYNQLGRNTDPAKAIILRINGEEYIAKSCNGKTTYEWNGQTHTLPLSRVDIMKLIAPGRVDPQRRTHSRTLDRLLPQN